MKREKLEAKIRKTQRNVPLHDFETLVKQYGYIKEGGKHPQAIIGVFTLVYKRENPMKSAYVRQLLQFIDICKGGEV